MPLQITPNPRSSGNLSIAENLRARFSSIISVAWSAITGKPVILDDIGNLSPSANTYLYFDAFADPQLGSISPFSRTVLDDTTSNAWLTTLTATRSESGAASVTLLDKTRQIIIPADFGAVGDGVADDTTALQKMANAACLVGAHVIFPSYKNYKITSEIVWKPQVSDGYSPPYTTTPSDLLFIQKRPVIVSMNGSKITAAASMTNMFHFVFDGVNGWVAPFYSQVNGGVFNGASLATNAIYSEWCLGFEAHGNRIDGVTSGIKCTGYGTHKFSGNYIRAAIGFDLTDGGADSHFGPLNDFYVSQCAFYMTAATSGQLRIFSNSATNEAQGTAYFVKIDATANTNILRNVAVIGNGVSGHDALVYARGSAGAFNIKWFQVIANNVLDYGAKTSIGLIDATETDGWLVQGNCFNATTLVATSKTILMTNDARSSIEDNLIHSVDQAAVQVAFGSRTKISGNRLHNVGSVTNQKAIRITNASSNVTIDGNVIDQDSSAYAQSGIVEEDTSNNNRAFNNTFNNVATPYTRVGVSSSFGEITDDQIVFRAAVFN